MYASLLPAAAVASSKSKVAHIKTAAKTGEVGDVVEVTSGRGQQADQRTTRLLINRPVYPMLTGNGRSFRFIQNPFRNFKVVNSLTATAEFRAARFLPECENNRQAKPANSN
ncbi:MAG: hypothetical protein ACRYFX_26295 [Janthinobacterium lividum]